MGKRMTIHAVILLISIHDISVKIRIYSHAKNVLLVTIMMKNQETHLALAQSHIAMRLEKRRIASHQ